MVVRHRFSSLALAALLLVIPASMSRAAYTVGSIDTQNGWSGGGTTGSPAMINNTIDQAITTADAHTGTQSWRISNSTINGFPSSSFGIFGGFPFSPSLSVPAGQPSSGALANRFAATYWFKSASQSAAGDGSEMEFYFGDPNGTDRVNSFDIRNVANANGGLLVELRETVSPRIAGSSFLATQRIASTLDRTAWHRIDMTGVFEDGGLDYYNVSIDGNSITNNDAVSPNNGTNKFNTWEGFLNNNGNPYEQTSRFYYRASVSGSSAGYTDNSPLGFYVDDLAYDSYNSANPSLILSSFDSNSFEAAAIPEPSTAAVASILAIGALMRYRTARSRR
jgi:hypothetical protein